MMQPVSTINRLRGEAVRRFAEVREQLSTDDKHDREKVLIDGFKLTLAIGDLNTILNEIKKLR